MQQVEIRIKGLIGEGWSDWFEDMEISHVGVCETKLSGTIPDQAALFGLIAKIRDLGLTLLSVNILEQNHDLT